MIKLIIGIVLLILILLVAHFIFVENIKESFLGSAPGSGAPQNDYELLKQDIRVFLLAPTESNFANISERCCPKILSGSNDIRKILHEIDPAKFQENHATILTLCDKINKGISKPLKDRKCSELGSYWCYLNEDCMLEDRRVGICKDKCNRSIIEEGDTCEGPCVTDRVNEFKVKCGNYLDPLECNNASILKDNGDNVKMCNWDPNIGMNVCSSKCIGLDEPKCNNLEFCEYDTYNNICLEKDCYEANMDEYCQENNYCNPETDGYSGCPDLTIQSECNSNEKCKFDDDNLFPFCTERV